jgi:hypothetical protein
VSHRPGAQVVTAGEARRDCGEYRQAAGAVATGLVHGSLAADGTYRPNQIDQIAQARRAAAAICTSSHGNKHHR